MNTDLRLAKITGEQMDILDRAIAEKRDLNRAEEKRFDILEYQAKEILKEPLKAPVERPIPRNQSERAAIAQRGDTTMSEYRNTPEFRDYCTAVMTGHINRDLQKDLDTQGGFITIPEHIVRDIIKSLDNMVFIRSLAQRFVVPADSVGIPTLADDVDDPEFTGEISPSSMDTGMKFEKRNITPRRLTKGIKWSRTLATIGAIPVADFLQSRLIYKLSVVEESTFLTGTGANEPLGLFTTSDVGISADRNVSAGNSSTEVKADNLIETLYSLKSQYVQDPTCRWIFHRNVLKQIKKLKTGDGDYIFSIDTAGVPRILGVPVVQSEYAPSTMTSGLRVGIVGALRFYGIAEHVAGYKVQTLTELYALTNQNATIIEKWVDGGPLLEEAFSIVALS